MLDFIKSLIQDMIGQDDSEAVLTEERLATAALLIRMIAFDGSNGAEELAVLRSALAQTFAVTHAQADLLIERARERAADSIDFYEFTSVLKRKFDRAGRARVIGMMWELAFADGEIREMEDDVVWRVADLLEVPAADRLALRKKFSR